MCYEAHCKWNPSETIASKYEKLMKERKKERKKGKKEGRKEGKRK